MSPKCRLCRSKNTQKAFISENIHGRRHLSNDKFTIYLCHHCQTYFLDKIEKSKHYYDRYYQTNYYTKPSFLANLLATPGYTNRKKTIIKLLKRSHNISILDVGCGHDKFLHSLPENDFKKTGIDINPLVAKNNPNIIHGDITTHNFGSTKFDCITLCQVFEHLPNPQLALKKIFHILKPTGLLLLDTPNSNSLGFKYGQKYYFHLDSPRHLFIPNPNSITLALKQAGFTKIKIINPFTSYPQDLIWSLRHSPIKFFVYPLYPIFKILSSELLTVYATK